MCGIVGYVGMRSAQQVLLDGLEKLEYRGYDSAGVALTQRDGIRVVKSKGRLSTLRSKLEELALPQSGCGIGHTRWATHGEPSDVNSHPHSTPRVSIVHNGIIENYGALKERLVAKGYTFTSETDTEVLVKLIDSCYQGEPLQALQAALAKVRGSYALAVLFKDYPDTIFAVKRESPLIVGWGEGENFVASDIPALLKYTRSYSVLEEGDMAVCTAQGIRFYNEFGEAVEREKLTADWDMEAAEKGGYPHFMLKEINEEPAAITATVSPRVENGLPELRIPELTDEKLRSIGTVHLVGCGTAMHAGMVGKTAIEALARVPAEVDIASEFRYRDPILKPEDLVIIISQSGETSDTLAALKLAKSRGVPVLAIVNVVGSSIARAADYVMYTYAGPEIAVASTKAYMVQLCVLYLFALRLAYARGQLTEEKTKYYTAQLLHASEVIKPRLADCEQIKPLCEHPELLFHRARVRLRPFAGGQPEAEGDQLCALGCLRRRRAEARHHQPDHGRRTGHRTGDPEKRLRKDHLQRQGDPQPRRTGAAVHHQGRGSAGGRCHRGNPLGRVRRHPDAAAAHRALAAVRLLHGGAARLRRG